MLGDKVSEVENDGVGIAMEATLVKAATTSSNKYLRLWRLSFTVSLFIKKASRKYVPLRSHHVIDVDEGHSLPQMVKTRDLHSLNKHGGILGVASLLGTNLETGLVDQGSRRQVSNSNNNPVSAQGFLRFFLNSCNSYTIILLFISAALSFAVEMLEQGPQYGWHDGAAILVAIILLVTVPSIGNIHRAREQAKLLQEKNSLKVEIVRSGKKILIDLCELKVGDIIHLKKDDHVPADGLFVEGEAFSVDEPLYSEISCDTNPFLLSGSRVTEGRGNMLAVSVGASTGLGEGLGRVTQNPKERTFFEAHVDKPNSNSDNLALSVSVLIALVVLIRLFSVKQHNNDAILPEMKGNVQLRMLMKILESIFLRPTGTVRILLGALTVVVIGMQHGMPFAISVSLSVWSETVESAGVKSQNLSACSTIGLATVICVNAVSKLICSRVEVSKVFIGPEAIDNDQDNNAEEVILQALRRGIRVTALMPRSSRTQINDLLVCWGKAKWGVDTEFSNKSILVLEHGTLNSDKYGSWALMQENRDDKKTIFHFNRHGSASKILKVCSHYYDSYGRVHAMEGRKRNFEQVIMEMEGAGLQAIAFACKQSEDGLQVDISEVIDNKWHLLAIVGLKYSCREAAKKAIKSLKDAGLRILLVSDEELPVVRALAHDLNICVPGINTAELHEWEEIHELDTKTRTEKIGNTVVLGSCMSEERLIVVQTLQQKGEIVGFLGGSSVGDVPALKQADVGITIEAQPINVASENQEMMTMTQSTIMARESSDIVIIDDEGSLFTAVKLGRFAYHNIRMFSQLQLTTCISGLLINLVAAACLWDSPLTAIQLIWVNTITCILGGLMLVMELKIEEPNTPPIQERNQSLITWTMWKSIATQVVYQASVLLLLHLLGLTIHSMSEEVWKSIVFTSFMLCQVFNQFKVMRLPSKEAFAVVLKNHWFIVAVAAVILMQVVLVEFVECLGTCIKLNTWHWVVCFVIPAVSFCCEPAIKLILDSVNGWFSMSANNSQFRHAWRMPFPGVLVSASFAITFCYYFHPHNV